MEPPDKNWFVEIDETVYEATTETIDQWIWDGTVLSNHRVSRGGQRWLEAGKVPRFADHFSPSREIKEVLSEGVGVNAAPPVAESRYTPSTASENLTPPLGVRLMAGSTIALLIALLGGYLWAYQFSAPKDLTVINNSLEMRALQADYDVEKSRIEGRKTAVEAARQRAAAAAMQAGELRDTRFNFIDCDRSGPETDSVCLELRKQPGRWLQETEKMKAAMQRVAQHKPAAVPDYDAQLSDLDSKFETDRNRLIAEARSADARSKFYQTFVLLFLGLAGLNLARLSFTPKN